MQEAITAPIPAAASMLGVGRTTLYGLIRAGDIETIHVGARRVVVVDSLREYVARQRAQQNSAGK